MDSMRLKTTTPKRKLSPTADAFFRIQRGLCGYVSYLAACDMNQAFSEYVLYEPILRILTARKFIVECEYECPGIKQPKTGDKKRLDFYARKRDLKFAIEVKWVKNSKPSLSRDTAKLRAFLTSIPNSRAFICVFGRRSFVEPLALAPLRDGRFVELGKAIYADFRRTRYGCRVFELKLGGRKGKK